VSPASDHPGLPDRDNHPPVSSGQYVGQGNVLYRATAQQIYVHTCFLPPAQPPRASPTACRCQDSRLLKAQAQLENLITRLVVLAERSHTAVDHLADLFQPDEAAPTSSCRLSSDAQEPEQPGRSA
jgi:hypothetical protein